MPIKNEQKQSYNKINDFEAPPFFKLLWKTLKEQMKYKYFVTYLLLIEFSKVGRAETKTSNRPHVAPRP